MSDNEVLVVASKVKNYIKANGEMKTSSSVLEVLSDRIRSLCQQAIENARNDGRKTVLDRDFM
jgi:histone H3/H4